MWWICASWAQVIGTWFVMKAPPGAALGSDYLDLRSAIWAIWIAMTVLTIALVRRSKVEGWLLLFTGFFFATIFSLAVDTPSMKQYLNQLHSQYVRSARVDVLRIERRIGTNHKGGGSYAYEIAVLRHPWKKDATIEFSAQYVTAKPGDYLCLPIYAGLHGQWAGAPLPCPDSKMR